MLLGLLVNYAKIVSLKEKKVFMTYIILVLDKQGEILDVITKERLHMLVFF